MSCRPTRRSIRRRSTSSATGSTPTNTRRTPRPMSWPATGWTRSSRRWSSSVGSPGRRGCRCCCGPRPSSTLGLSWCSARARPTPRSYWPRSPTWSTGYVTSAKVLCGSPACLPSPRSSSCSRTRPSSSARRSTSRSGSSTSRPWPAARLWSPPGSGASPKWWTTA